MLIQAAVVTSALALWLWFLADCAERLFKYANGRDDPPMIITKRNAMIAAPIIVVVSLALTHQIRKGYPEVMRTPVSCVGDGVDYDIRDGLCYTQVPKSFQRY